MRYLLCVFIVLSIPVLAVSSQDLIGTRAPEWHNSEWINAKPLKLSELNGRVVLLRFFMESACPYCRATAPHLNRLYDAYKDRGLVVIGMYTPKPKPSKTSKQSVERYVRDYGFLFPVAVDAEWNTLNKFWLDHVPDADYTSVSFLIDKSGTIRYIHSGGSYSDQEAFYIEKQIQKLLSE